MAYVSTRKVHNDDVPVVAVHQFATDLCAALGGTGLNLIPKGMDGEEAEFLIGQDRLRLYTPWRERKVEVRISADDIAKDERTDLRHSPSPKSASVDPDARPIATIAKDIRRRVIDASAEALAAQRAVIARNRTTRTGMDDLAAEFEALDLAVAKNPDGLSLRVSTHKGFNAATVTATGGKIERMDEVSLEKFKRIMAIINE